MSTATTIEPAPATRFSHRPPSKAAQWGIWLAMNGLMRPMVRTLEAVGRAEKVLGAMGAASRKRQEQNPFRSYTPAPQDVIVMTFPKSGTNWMLQITHQLIHHARGEYDHIHDVVPWPDVATMPGFMRRYAIPLADADWRHAPERKRVIKTHYDWNLLPYSTAAHYIAVIRDPKDVFVSSYFFVRDGLYGNAMPTPGTWFRLFLSGNFPLVGGGSWAVNAAGYWAERHRPNVLVLPFKAMKRDLRAAVRQVAAFLGVNASNDVIEDVCRLSSFTYMKGIDHKFNMGQLNPMREAGSMIRKGSQGGSSELLSAAQQRQIDDHFQSELRALGSDLPYAEFCDLAPPAAR